MTIDELPPPDRTFRRPGESGGWQDGITRVIDGHTHIFGCRYDADCWSETGVNVITMQPYAAGEWHIICDCPCHNRSTP